MEDRPLDESALVERARRGDVRAYEALMEMYEGIAFRTAYVIARNESDAEDAVQEAFYRAYAALGRFRRGAPFRPWLLRIVANEAKDRRAATARAGSLALRAADLSPPGSSVPAPGVAAVLQEEKAQVLAALNALSERDRLVIAYRFLLELSEGEMAALLDCPRGTVKSRLSRALDRLRNQLEEGE